MEHADASQSFFRPVQVVAHPVDSYALTAVDALMKNQRVLKIQMTILKNKVISSFLQSNVKIDKWNDGICTVVLEVSSTSTGSSFLPFTYFCVTTTNKL